MKYLKTLSVVLAINTILVFAVVWFATYDLWAIAACLLPFIVNVLRAWPGKATPVTLQLLGVYLMALFCLVVMFATLQNVSKGLPTFPLEFLLMVDIALSIGLTIYAGVLFLWSLPSRFR